MDSTRGAAHEATQPLLPFLYEKSSRCARENFPCNTGRLCELLFDAGEMTREAPPGRGEPPQVETAKHSA
jgi:hypothetical protein